MIVNESLLRLTKKYIIDLLNCAFFGESIAWDGTDQFNEMFLLRSEEDNELDSPDNRRAIREVRSGYAFGTGSVGFNFVTLRILISVEDSSSKKVCYRITPITKRTDFSNDNGRTIRFPPEHLVFDFSISDLNLGIEDLSSYSFYDNIGNTGNIELAKLFKFLTILLNCNFISLADDEEAFEDLIDAQESHPPIVGDTHYAPVFGVNNG